MTLEDIVVRSVMILFGIGVVNLYRYLITSCTPEQKR